MSKSRVAMLVVLILLAGGSFVVLGLTVAKRFPGYYWSRAEQAFESENYEHARINLQKLLKRYPDHDRAHELMARVILNEAAANQRPATYLANPRAVRHLERAAELRPGDMDLQRRLVRAYLQNPGQWGKAAPIAQEIYRVDPTNGDAHFALTWQAVERKNRARAEELFSAFPDIASSHVFETLALQAKLYWELEEEEKADAALESARDLAEQLTAEQLELLVRRDRERMLAVLLAYQDRAEDPAEALKRAKSVVDACFKLDEANLVDKRTAANAAAQSIALYNMRFPSLHGEKAHELLRDELAARVQELGDKALEVAAEVDAAAPMLLYWNNARTLMAQGKYNEALKVLNDGLAAVEKLGDVVGSQHLDLHLLAARVLIMQRKFPEANVHLDKLLGNPRFESWSHLLKGSVALHEGRLETAHSSFLQARQSMGDKILVRMSLARTHMAREEWDQAIALLESLQVPREQLSDEEQAWYQQLLGGGDRVEFDLLRARLALGQWEAAKERLRVLRDTDLAPSAYGMAVTYLWEDAKDHELAKRYLNATREKYPDELSLVLLESRMLKEEGETVRAGKILEDFAAAKPEDELRQLALARWQIRNNEPQRALNTLNALDQLPELSERAHNTLMVYRVQALLGSRQIEAAKTQCEVLIANPGTATAGHLFKASIAFMERNEKAGVEHLERALASNPRNQALTMMLTKIREQQGDHSAVLDGIAELAGVSRYQGQVQMTVSETLRKIAQAEGPEKALERADAMLARRPDDLALRVLKVDFLLKLDRFNEGMRELAEAERRSPRDPNIPRLKAQAHMIQGNHAAALAEAQKALQIEDQAKNVELQALAAQAAIGAGQVAEGTRYAQAVVQMEPNAPRGYLLLAECYRKSEPPRVEDAIRVLQVYAQRRPNDFAIHETIAGLYREQGDVDSAVAWMQRARFAQPNDMRFVVRELEMLLDANRIAEARALAGERAGRSNNAFDVLLVAQAFAGVDEFADSQQWGERALAAAGSDIAQRATANSFLGRIYLKRASAEGSNVLYEKARDHFRAVLSDQPADLVAGNNLAWILAVHLNQPQDAVRVVDDVQRRSGVAVDQLPLEFVDTMAVVYNRAGQTQKAQSILKQAVAKNPRSASLLYQLGLTMIDGQPAQAKEMLSRAVELGLPAEDEAEARRQLARL